MNQIPHDPTQLVLNYLFSRTSFYPTLYDGKFGTRDIDAECGYPSDISTREYMRLYLREGIAARINDIEPNECWKEYPEVYETEENRETEFEMAVDKVIAETNLYSYLARLDRVSGIGRYGVLFIGLDDGSKFEDPAPGYTESSEAETPGSAKVLYYRVFSEGSVSIAEFENDEGNPRYGQPKYYTLNFSDWLDSATNVGEAPASQSVKVHWSRIHHVADNALESEIYGSPRMENVLNRIFDLRKVNGGAAEMFWKGGFPGYSFEVDPKHGEFTETEKEALRSEAKEYSEGLQRYLTTVGVSVKSLSPQVADPSATVDNILRLIAITKGIPSQVFMGTQQGQLDSPQDAITWAERIALRRNMYVSPHIIRPIIQKFVQYGAVPSPIEGRNAFTIKWLPIAKLTEIEQSEVAKNKAEALARYATSGSEALMPRNEFMDKVMGFSPQQIEAIELAQATEFSVVLQELKMLGMSPTSGAAGGNVPSSIPGMAKPGQKKDPSKTPVNVQQRKGRVRASKASAGKPPTTEQ